MGKIIAFYYGSSASDVTTLCTAGASGKIVDIIVLQNSPSYKPTYSSTVKSLVAAANAQNVKVFGYVDSGGANFPTYAQVSGLKAQSGSSCVSVSRYPTLHIANPSPESGYWCHRAYNSTDVDLSTGPNYTNYYGTLRKQVLSSSSDICADWYGYLSEDVDLWLSTTSGSGYGAQGIMWDNCYPGSPTSANAPTTDSRYLWYKSICDTARSTYSSAEFLLNCGNYCSNEWWFTNHTHGSSPFFDFMNISETDYGKYGTSHFPPNSDSVNSPYPSWLTGGSYASYLCALCTDASGISAADTQSWFDDCCNNGIKFGYISTYSGGFGSVPSNFSTQYADAAGTTC